MRLEANGALDKEWKVAGEKVKGADWNTIRPEKFGKVLEEFIKATGENTKLWGEGIEDTFLNIKMAGEGMKVKDDS